jgi:hypothetical protein
VADPVVEVLGADHGCSPCIETTPDLSKRRTGFEICHGESARGRVANTWSVAPKKPAPDQFVDWGPDGVVTPEKNLLAISALSE